MWRESASKAANLMTHDCVFNSRLSAFHDGELDPAASREIQQHLQTCADCAGQLEEIRGMSSLFGSFGSDPITEDELARVHEAVDNVDAPLQLERVSPFRIAGFLTAAAASILVISAAWLREMPAGNPTLPHRTVVRLDGWEYAAANLTAPPGLSDQSDTAMARDTGAEDWMLRQLQN